MLDVIQLINKIGKTMNKTLKYAVSGMAAAFLLTGCTYKTSAGVSNVDLSNTNMSKVDTLKSGESCQSWFLIFPTGFNTTAKEAAKNGGISKIEYQEMSSTNYLIGGSVCLTVYGK